MSTEDDTRAQIDRLVEEQHRLRDGDTDDAARSRLTDIEVELDRLWDLLRRREAARDAGTDPDEVRESSAERVENYLQ